MATTKPPAPRGPVARKLPPAPMPRPIAQRRPFPLDLNGAMPEPRGASTASAILQRTAYYGLVRSGPV